MIASDKDRLLSYAAKRARLRPSYLGWIFARYIELENSSAYELGKILGAETNDLSRIELCLKPREEFFADDVKQIASKFNVNPGELARVIRLVEAVEAMTSLDNEKISMETGFLLAARAREGEKLEHEEDLADDESKS